MLIENGKRLIIIGYFLIACTCVYFSNKFILHIHLVMKAVQNQHLHKCILILRWFATSICDSVPPFLKHLIFYQFKHWKVENLFHTNTTYSIDHTPSFAYIQVLFRPYLITHCFFFSNQYNTTDRDGILTLICCWCMFRKICNINTGWTPWTQTKYETRSFLKPWGLISWC